MIILASARRRSTAEPTAYFAKWVDHDNWSEWSPDTEWVELEGPVEVGVRGVLKPVGGPKTAFVVAECTPDRVYTDVSRLPGARLTFRHAVAPAAGGSELHVEVTLEGPLAWLWARSVFRHFPDSVPQDLDRIIAVVERRSPGR